MNDEIKEILDKLNNCKWEKDTEEITYKILFSNEVYKLLDYITNLQQENEYLKKNNPEQNIEHFRIIKENKRKINNLREQNKTLQESNQNMQEEMARVWEENERLKEENIEIRQCLLIKRRSIPHKLTMDKSIEEILDMPTYEDYKSRCEKASVILNNIYMLDNVTITNNACEEIDNAINILQGENNGN